MTKDRFAAHIAEVCTEHDVTIGPHSSGGRAWRVARHVNIRPVKSAITYAVALHELGHVLGPDQSQPRLYKEAGAWLWATENAVTWTDTMDRKMVSSLDAYLEWATVRHQRNVKNAPRIPALDHYFWRLLAGINVD